MEYKKLKPGILLIAPIDSPSTNLKEYYQKFDIPFLQEMLKKAVKTEEFEIASIIRDVINSKTV